MRLSELINDIDETLQDRFAGETFWITSEITDVKKQADKRWCFLKFIEKEERTVIAEMKAVFWSVSYHHIERFEQLTRQSFATGLEITCCVRVRFHPRYGLDLEVLEIDLSAAIAKAASERDLTLARLVKENPSFIRLADGQYYTVNKKLPLPIVLQRIALITAPDSDGQRDFKNELAHNPWQYGFALTEFLTQIQGDSVSRLLLQQLAKIESQKEKFDVVAIVRGGGSETDFKPFEDYDLARKVAAFPLPILTGIGHDRNTSIVDMMARQHKTPTKVASSIVDHNFRFERELLDTKERLAILAKNRIAQAVADLQHMKRTIKAYSPATILGKGYAIITHNDKIIVDPKKLKPDDQIKTLLKNQLIESTITKKTKHEPDL